MANILILYATYDGTTRQVAERLAVAVTRAGHEPTLVDFLRERPTGHVLERAHAVMVAAGIRYGHYDRGFERFVKDNRELLARRPNAFCSVCMSAGGPGARPEQAQGYIDTFVKATGWKPQRATSFAGACLFTQYNPFIRFMMRLIMGMAGGETDTSRDWRYTDFEAVERYGAGFVASLEAVPA